MYETRRRCKPQEAVCAAVRYDLDMREPEHRTTARETVRNHTIAAAEVNRPIRVQDDKRCRCFWQTTRLNLGRRSKKAPQSLASMTKRPQGARSRSVARLNACGALPLLIPIQPITLTERYPLHRLIARHCPCRMSSIWSQSKSYTVRRLDPPLSDHMRYLIFLLVSLSLGGCAAPARAVVPAPIQGTPSGLAVRFQVAACIAYEIDTFSGTLVRFEPELPPVQTTLLLSPEQVRAFEEEIARVDFFTLPAELRPDSIRFSLERTPFTGYRLEIQAGGRRHAVRWTDRFTRAPEVLRMLPLLRLFWDLIKGAEAEGRLPPAFRACI